ncbi:hypothetical protein, partial [Pseudomonas viridiflava]|uniref:hypothetical protein n=1 Tax=Pseudomonas viridiflava TaxID=33069 RepID=UPI00198144A2
WAPALKNKENFQFTWVAKVGFLVLNTTAPHPETEDWNFRGFQTRLADMQGSYAANLIITDLPCK